MSNLGVDFKVSMMEVNGKTYKLTIWVLKKLLLIYHDITNKRGRFNRILLDKKGLGP